MKISRVSNGFTFVEVLIIVTVIGLLAVMAVPAFQQVRKQEQRRKITSNLEQIVMIGHHYLNAEHADHVTYDELIAKGYLHPLTSIAGEQYTGLSIQKEKGSLQVIYGEQTVSYQY
jgi:Tfp pilus assembly protein PilE